MTDHAVALRVSLFMVFVCRSSIFQLTEASLRLFRELDDRAGTALALNTLANVAGDCGDYPQALALYEELGIPSMMLSGLVDDETIVHARSIPVFHYLVKPVPMEDLGSAIQVAWRRFKEREKPAADSNRPTG